MTTMTTAAVVTVTVATTSDNDKGTVQRHVKLNVFAVNESNESLLEGRRTATESPRRLTPLPRSIDEDEKVSNIQLEKKLFNIPHLFDQCR